MSDSPLFVPGRGPDEAPPPAEWCEPGDLERYWRERAEYWEGKAEERGETISDLSHDLREAEEKLIAAGAKPPKPPPPDSEIVARAKRMLLTMKGFGMVNDAAQSFTMPPKIAERLVAMAMLGADFQAAMDAGMLATPEIATKLYSRWIERTNLLVGDIVKDEANG